MDVKIVTLLFFLALAALLLPILQKTLKVTRWKNKWRIKEHQLVFNRLYDNLNGFLISKKARNDNGDAPEYLYGEIEFTSFIALISQSSPNHQSVFYDLGSGTGKAVLSCAMVFGVKKSCGIELFTELHQTALKQRDSLQKIAGYEEISKSIQFLNSDFLQANFSDATIIFINSTALFGTVWLKLNERLEKITTDALIITISKPLHSAFFVVIKSSIVQMSWGPVKAFIHQRISAA